MIGIVDQIEDLYRTHPRHDVSHLLIQHVLSAVADKASLLEHFILVYAAFSSTLYHVVGIAFGTRFLCSP